MALGFDASRISYSVGKNKTESTGNSSSHNETETIDVAAIVGVVVHTLTIIIAGILIAVAILHKAKFRRVLLIWLVFTVMWIVITIIALFIRVIVYKTGYIDIFITFVFCFYEVICCWLVWSYYKLLKAVGDHHQVGYDVFANDNEFAAMETPSEVND